MNLSEAGFESRILKIVKDHLCILEARTNINYSGNNILDVKS